jgi:hypothetical protein
MPNSGRKTRLQSYAWLWSMSQLQSYLLTPITHHGFGRWACRMSYHLSYERLRMVRLDECSILQARHLVESRLRGTHDSFSIWNLNISQLRMFKIQAMCRVTNEHLAQLDLRETRISKGLGTPCNLGGSGTSNVRLGEPRLYATRPWH